MRGTGLCQENAVLRVFFLGPVSLRNFSLACTRAARMTTYAWSKKRGLEPASRAFQPLLTRPSRRTKKRSPIPVGSRPFLRTRGGDRRDDYCPRPRRARDLDYLAAGDLEPMKVCTLLVRVIAAQGRGSWSMSNRFIPQLPKRSQIRGSGHLLRWQDRDACACKTTLSRIPSRPALRSLPRCGLIGRSEPAGGQRP